MLPSAVNSYSLAQALASAIRQHGKPTTERHTGTVPGLKVTRSVRHPDGGRPFRFEHVAQTISHLDAEIRANAAARREGLKPWCLISIE